MADKIAIYSRKSKWTGKGESIENQINLCKEHIQFLNKGAPLADEDFLVFEDEGYSGKNTDRPRYKDMMAAIEEGHVKTVVCYKLDRISRSTADFVLLKEHLDSLGVEFVSVSENFDTSTPAGKAMMSIVVTFAQMERETTAERVRDNMRELAKTGRWLGGQAPIGYRSYQSVGSISATGKERTAHFLEVVPEEAEIVKMLYAKYLETNSALKVERYCKENGIVTRLGRQYERNNIRRILANPAYAISDENTTAYFAEHGVEVYGAQENSGRGLGLCAYGKLDETKGNCYKRLAVSEWVVAVGKHPGLITGKEWVRVQRMIDRNRCKTIRRPRSEMALLSGLLFCKDCGSYMRPKFRQFSAKDGTPLYSYMCENKEHSKKELCNMKNVKKGFLMDALVCEEIKRLGDNNFALIDYLDKQQRQVMKDQNEADRQLAAQQRQLSKTEGRIKNLIAQLSATDDATVTGYIRDEINSLHLEKQKITDQMDDLMQMARAKDYSIREMQLMQLWISDFAHTISTMSVAQKREMIRKFVSRIEWDGETLDIYFFGGEDEKGVVSNEISAKEAVLAPSLTPCSPSTI